MTAATGSLVRVIRADPLFMDRVGEVVGFLGDGQALVQFKGFQQRFSTEQLWEVPETEGYLVARAADKRVLCFVRRDSAVSHVPHVGVHSPDGFETGYSGSGPSDLALSILCEFLEVDPQGLVGIKALDLSRDARIAWDAHGSFRDRFIAPHKLELVHSEYVIPMGVVRSFVERHGAAVCEAEI